MRLGLELKLVGWFKMYENYGKECGRGMSVSMYVFFLFICPTFQPGTFFQNKFQCNIITSFSSHSGSIVWSLFTIEVNQFKY